MSHTIELSTDRWPDTTSLSCLIFLKSQAWLNRVPVAEDSEEMQLFLGFIKACGGLTAYRTEWMLFSESHRLAGSIDFVAMDCDQNLVLFDWKRSKGLRQISVLLRANVGTLKPHARLPRHALPIAAELL
jgi:hypothetical protein